MVAAGGRAGASWPGRKLSGVWVGRSARRLNRLHDRLRYRKQDVGWVIERLAP